VKLVVDEAESDALEDYLRQLPTRLASSRVARVEVTRAVRLANPSLALQAAVRERFDRMLLVDVGDVIIEAACHLASATVRTLEAIHLATLQLVDPHEVVVYDGRLIDAARALGYRTVSPGAPAEA
jgi:uncharacterized protein